MGNEYETKKGQVYEVTDEESSLGQNKLNNEVIFIGNKKNKDYYLIDENPNGDRDFKVYTLDKDELESFTEKKDKIYSENETNNFISNAKGKNKLK